MRRSKTLAKLRAGKAVRMCVFGHFIPAYITHAAKAGYDCLWLDLEHRQFSGREIQSLLAYCHLADIDCMIRPPTLEKTGLYRYLEDGATGLMVPHVSTAEKARMLVDAVKFPPLGDRGLDNAGLDSDFNHHGPDEYVEHANSETFLTVQLETPEAIANVDEIAAVDGVDILFIGTGDLGMRIRRLPDVGFTLEEAIERVAAAAAKAGRAWCCPAGSKEDLKRYYDMGARFVPWGSDFAAVRQMLESSATDLDEIYGKS
jgi:2-keto-3-deoxy-L-rhamnonate aldolase RhmA